MTTARSAMQELGPWPAEPSAGVLIADNTVHAGRPTADYSLIEA